MGSSPKIQALLKRDPAFASILHNEDHPAAAISTFLQGEGIEISASTIRSYRLERRRKGQS